MVLRGNAFCEAVVDTWPAFTSVIIRPLEKVSILNVVSIKSFLYIVKPQNTFAP